ncbi:hypothetical protein Fmac_021650 [Flemingia macrophylla]|uniref:Uncharacterized protein n=1 Tax=Flemingia macrophylla TaxID=520843 RepID=A0ABD1LXJ5_9FABA
MDKDYIDDLNLNECHLDGPLELAHTEWGDKLITQFDLKLGNISGEEVLNLGKAFEEFIPEIIDETTIMKKSLIQITPLTKCTPLQTVAKAKHAQLLMDDETRNENNAEDSQPWSFMKVVVFIMLSVLRIPSHSRWVFLGLGVAFLKYQGDKLITQFDLKLGNISGEEVLNMGKAFEEFIPEIIDETTIMVEAMKSARLYFTNV